jgi:hypothetical protein
MEQRRECFGENHFECRGRRNEKDNEYGHRSTDPGFNDPLAPIARSNPA